MINYIGKAVSPYSTEKDGKDAQIYLIYILALEIDLIPELLNTYLVPRLILNNFE